MTELRVPVFDSYLKIQEDAIDEARYLNSVIVPQLKAKAIVTINLVTLAEASLQPDLFGLLDENNNPLKPREIKNARFLHYADSVSFNLHSFELWYHNIHPDGKKRAEFFEHLGDKEKLYLKYYK